MTAKKKRARRENSSFERKRGRGPVDGGPARPSLALHNLPFHFPQPQRRLCDPARKEAHLRLVRPRNLAKNSPSVVQPHPSTSKKNPRWPTKSDSCSPTAQSEAGLLSAWPPSGTPPQASQWSPSGRRSDRPRFAAWAVGAGGLSVQYVSTTTNMLLLHSGHASAGPMHRKPASGRHTLAFVAGCELLVLLRGSCGSNPPPANGVTGSASAGGLLLAMHPLVIRWSVCSGANTYLLNEPGHLEGSSF